MSRNRTWRTFQIWRLTRASPWLQEPGWGLCVSGLWRGGQWIEVKLRGRRELEPRAAQRRQVASAASPGEAEVGVLLTGKGFSEFLEKQ